MKALAVFLIIALSLFIGVTIGLHADPAATLKNCTRWAESEPGYSGNAVDNILRRDSLIRECMAR